MVIRQTADNSCLKAFLVFYLISSENINRLVKYELNKIYELSVNDFHEKLHNKFCKGNLRVKSNSINIMAEPSWVIFL